VTRWRDAVRYRSPARDVMLARMVVVVVVMALPDAGHRHAKTAAQKAS
jgi:hypothetical protein